MAKEQEMTRDFDLELHSHLLAEVKKSKLYKADELADWTCTGKTRDGRKRKRAERKRRREYTLEQAAYHAQCGYNRGFRGDKLKSYTRGKLRSDGNCGSFIAIVSIIYYIIKLIIAWKEATS